MALSTLVAGLVGVSATPAAADQAASAKASAFAVSVSLGGQPAVPPTPVAEVTLPPGGEASETVIDVPAEPLVVSGTLNADAAVHAASDLASALTVEEQAVPGPYNAQGVALIEGLDVLVDAAGPGVSLLSADAIRAEAAAVCRGNSIAYSATSEIIDLHVGGEPIPLNAPVADLVDAISDVLEGSGLSAVVDVARNVVTTPEDGGIAVSALVVSVAEAGGPLAVLTIGHAEVGAAACAPPPLPPVLPLTGGADNTALLAALLGSAGLGMAALRRRAQR